MRYTLPHEAPSVLHPGKMKWNGYSVSEITGPFYLLSVRMISTLYKEPPSALHPDASPWEDEVERSFSFRNHRIILSSQCEDAFYTVQRTTISASPWLDKVERSFSLRNHRITLSSQCEDTFYTVQRTHQQFTLAR
ncbi:hypothetical protein T02_7093 [Trichinella nativa]|uniref:Uncharacterized protein n=1 Tax=Trichinella nativa TaxID=6335 RepID=A0A0V1KW71_9BILA|nr:hypothetical protein T02_7093 [Trichinella nativa]